MTFNDIHREETPDVGEQQDTPIQDPTGIAPSYVDCGQREAARNVDRCVECFVPKMSRMNSARTVIYLFCDAFGLLTGS